MKLGAVLAVAGGGVAAALGPSAPAVAFSSGPLFLDIQAESPATLVARGAAVDVTLEVTCNSLIPTNVGVILTQRVSGSGVAQGSGSAQVACTGAHQRIIVRVTASATGEPFRARPALADSSIFGCLESVCGGEQDSTTIDIRR